MDNYSTNSQDNKTSESAQTTADKVLAKLESTPDIKVKKEGNGSYRCSGNPCRPGSDSDGFILTLSPDGEHGAYHDHASGESGSLYELAGSLEIEPTKADDSRPSQDECCTDYHNEYSEVVMQAVRSPGKKFWARRPDGKGDWIKNLKGIKRPPLNLPALISAAPDIPVLICEGEQDAKTAQWLGFLATTNLGGAGNFHSIHKEYIAKAFADRRIVILSDNDQAGAGRNKKISEQLAPIAHSIQVVDPTTWGKAKGADLSDWAKGGGTFKELQKIIKDAPAYQSGVTVLTPEGIKTAQVSTWDDTDKILGPIEWEWSGWLAKGFKTLAASMSGDGKSFLLLRIAATYLQGLPWPDGTPFEGETGKVLWCETEAAQALNLGRAKGLGLKLADLINPLENPLEDIDLSDPAHRAAIESAAQRDDIKLVVIDSLSGGTTGRDNKNSGDMLIIGKWLAELARDTNKPVLVSHHLRKKSVFDGDKINLDRLRDSSSIVQTARIVWAIDAPDYEYPEQKRLYVIKSNLGRFPDSLGFEIDGGQRVAFGEAPEMPREETQQDKATDLLRTLLAGGPVRMKDIKEEAEGAALSMITMRRAKGKLNVVARKSPDGWYWSLPARN